MTTLTEGTAAVGLARETLETQIPTSGDGEPVEPVAPASLELPALMEEKRGLFVTLLTHPGHDLRGCIGFTDPILRLRDGIPRAALYAALEDPRFPPLEPHALSSIVVEVSLLTLPQPLLARIPQELPGLVKVGRDGLMVAADGLRGVLLPQVATEEGWDAETFLAHTCRKAGLSPSAWKRNGLRFWTFRSEIFAEQTPRGRVVERRTEAPRDGVA